MFGTAFLRVWAEQNLCSHAAGTQEAEVNATNMCERRTGGAARGFFPPSVNVTPVFVLEEMQHRAAFQTAVWTR